MALSRVVKVTNGLVPCRTDGVSNGDSKMVKWVEEERTEETRRENLPLRAEVFQG